MAAWFVAPRVELISIHIPKAAGVSFEHALRRAYGQNRFVRVNISFEKANRKKIPRGPLRLHRNVKVVHGHFRHRDVLKLYRLDRNIPVITWVRDPVSRVLSNYFYLGKVLRDMLKEAEYKSDYYNWNPEGILNRLQRSVLEFARLDANRNRMSRFLKGLSLEDFFFVGVVEHYSQDLAQLAQLLNWETVFEAHYNRSRKQWRPVSAEILDEIRSLNAEDQSIYDEALRLRQLRSEDSARETGNGPSAAFRK